MTRARLDRSPSDVAAMFDAVAARYDRTNDVLSLGLDRTWRRRVADEVRAAPGLRVLDLAAGTGTSAAALAARGATAIACDFSLGMLSTGRRARPDLPFVAGDALRLPFANGAFDAVTMSFGLRNTADVDTALREALRVTRPGGRLVICEFSAPVWAPVRRLYSGYLLRAVPAIARAVSSNPEAYVYLAESILDWPDQRGLAVRLAAAGWSSVRWTSRTGGIVALHSAVRN